MNIWQYLNNYSCLFLIIFIAFSGSLWGAVRWLVNSTFQHRQRMQEMRNEQLRLELQIAQTKGEHPYGYRPTAVPKEASWDEQPQATYENDYQTGYQEQTQ